MGIEICVTTIHNVAWIPVIMFTIFRVIFSITGNLMNLNLGIMLATSNQPFFKKLLWKEFGNKGCVFECTVLLKPICTGIRAMCPGAPSCWNQQVDSFCSNITIIMWLTLDTSSSNCVKKNRLMTRHQETLHHTVSSVGCNRTCE